MVESELHKLDTPKGKAGREQKAMQAKRQRRFDQLLGVNKDKPKKAQYADPAVMMGLK